MNEKSFLMAFRVCWYQRLFLSGRRLFFSPVNIWLAILLLTGGGQLTAQDFSNKGKDFWVGYGNHVSMYSSGVVNSSGGSQDMVLYFTSDQDANVTVAIPGLGWTKNYSVKANSITESDPMPKTAPYDARLSAEGTSKLGIHITSDNPVVAYAHIYDNNVSGASLLFPTPTLGRDYYVLGFTQESNSANSYPFCFVIATEDNTTVEVTPSANTLLHKAGVAFTQVLQKGEVLNLLGELTGGSGNNRTGVDLTGTRIRSISSGGSGCTKIAVFCGTGKLNIRCNTSGTSSADNTFQQSFPFSAWGKKYITVPTQSMPTNFFRVMVSDPATVVTLNGTRLTGLVNSSYYEFQSSAPGVIESDMPVLVAQFVTTANQCGNTALGTTGDPEMIYLSPVEQTISKITLNSTSHYNITRHFVNVVLKTGGIASFKLDGVARTSGFTTLSQDPSYSYAQFSVGAGVHNLQSDSGFNAIAYGYGSAESYGYNAGTNVIDLYQYVSIKNEFATTSLPATCEKLPFNLSITLPYIPVSMDWDFGGNASISPNAAVNINLPQPDSSFQKNGKTLYVFKVPGSYVFNATGTYPIKITVNNPSADGCSGIQQIDVDMQVFANPTVDWKSTQTGCFTDAVNFSADATASGRSIARYNWSFGDGAIDSIAAPQRKYTAAGNYTVRLQAITDIGCEAEAIKTVSLSSLPQPAFIAGDTTCVAHAVIYTNQSVIADGTIAHWYWDDGNGNKDTLHQALPFAAKYTAAGTYSPSLQVVSSTGCLSTRTSHTVTIGTYPVVDFEMPKVCLSDANAVFTDASSVSDNSALKYHWKFGDPNATTTNPDTSILKNGVHHYTAAAVYPVTSTVTSTHFCATSLTKQFTVNGAVPSAAFTVDNIASLCSNQEVKLLNQSTVDFGTVTRVMVYWDALNMPAQSYTDNTPYSGKTYANLYAKSGQPQSYKVTLQAYSGESCVNEVSKVLTLHASPTVSFTTVPSSCDGDNAFQITTAAETAGLTGSFTYSGTAVSSTGLFSPAVSRAGTFPIKALYIAADGCRDSATQQVQVFPVPLLGPMADVTVLEGGTAHLQPVVQAIQPSFLWTPSQQLSSNKVRDPYVIPVSDQQYTLTVTETGGCKVSGTVMVKVLKNLKLANAFSPNGDGINDTWSIPYIESYPGCRIDIFNRYGQKVFSSTGYLKEWDGTNNGKPLDAGTYYYVIDPGMGRGRMSGAVTILR